MAKTFLHKVYVLLDWENNEFKYYEVEVLSVGYNDVHLLYRYGKLGNKGREEVKRFDGEGSLKRAMDAGYAKLATKEEEGFFNRNDLRDHHFLFLANKKKKKAMPSSKKPISFVCDSCKKEIQKTLYDKIRAYARSAESGWDRNPTDPWYKKVYCISCQHDVGLFKQKKK